MNTGKSHGETLIWPVFHLAILEVNIKKSSKDETAKYSFELRYTLSKKSLECWYTIYLNGRVCFNAEAETTFSIGLYYLRKEHAPIGSMLFPLKVVPMKIENNFKGH